jgi:flavin reductase (DIM6/NTAB) family NADH-FMN oxidoreductase RutF
MAGIGSSVIREQGAVDGALLRAVAGTFATGITVITCPTDSGPTGCAANAVLSVSLEPPLMLISLGEGSRTRLAVASAGVFGIHILGSDAEGSALCAAFAGRGDDKFAGVAFRDGCLGVPVLDAALGWFECRVVSTQVAGDHTLILGRVVDAGHSAGEPLVFFRGQHRYLAA